MPESQSLSRAGQQGSPRRRRSNEEAWYFILTWEASHRELSQLQVRQTARVTLVARKLL